jgi:hypothetical protein
LGALRDFVHPEPNPVEEARHRKTALTHHFRESLSVGGVRTGFVLRYRSRRSVESDQRSRIRLDEGETTRKGGAGFGKRVGASPIKNDNACLDAERGERPGVVRNA